MLELPNNIRKVLVMLVPASIINEIACFVFYDEHPRDDRKIDITICTKGGEVREYYRRDLINSLLIEDAVDPSEIRIFRNNNCELFYIIFAKEELIILTRKEMLAVHNRVTNIERFEINDSMCSGQACLKIVCKDDAVPLIFDENFEKYQTPEMSETFTDMLDDDCYPVVTHLKRKLIEARYSVKCNESSYKELLDLRQLAAFSMYKRIHPNLDDSIIKGGLREMVGALNIKLLMPWVKFCNKKIVIAYIVCNENIEPLQDVHVLLHGTAKSLVYTTKLFKKINSPPFWRENTNQTLEQNIETAITVVMDLKEMKHSVTSRVEFGGVMFYSKSGKECLLPVENVVFSSMDTLGEEFDVLSGDKTDPDSILAILATTEKTNLLLRHINNHEDQHYQDKLELDIFKRYLGMEQVPGTECIVIHRNSPYHALNGVMIIKLSRGTDSDNCLTVSVHSRTPSQVLALIHYIHDAVPMKIVTTTVNCKITAKTEQLTKYSESITPDSCPSRKYIDYVPSIIDRSATILEYLDNSMIKMHESKNPTILSKIGQEIDLSAGGIEKLVEFRGKMLDKASEGFDAISKYDTSDVNIDNIIKNEY